MQSRNLIAAWSWLLIAAPILAAAASVDLNSVTFPERNTIRLDFIMTERAPHAEARAKVTFKEGQARIDINYDDMKPAILFGGDITCYVVWAVSRDGTVENLGELWMPDSDGNVELSTGRKDFALMVTAEPYAVVDDPSELVIMTTGPSKDKKAPSMPFSYSGFKSKPDHDVDTIARIAWDSEEPLDVLQAEKAAELAARFGVEEYLPSMFNDATLALNQARALAQSSKKKARLDYSRRSVSLFGVAMQITERKKESEELARQIAERRAEMTALDERARVAEQDAADARAAIAAAQQQREEAEEAVKTAELELTQLAAEQYALKEEQAALLTSMEALREEGQQLREQAERLRKEREELAGRLEGALSQVADTQDSARGLIVNLPDILFDVNKATLKHEAQLVIAKLVGILLIMPELNLRIEGHTDAQGSDEYNQTLSEQRATSVLVFLQDGGIAAKRITAVGYGETRPVADNETTAGRSQNRRVEVVIGTGDIAEGEAPSAPVGTAGENPSP